MKKAKLLVLTSTFPRWQDDTDPPFVFQMARRLTDTFSVTVHTPHSLGAKRKEVMAGIAVHRFRYFFERYEKLAGTTAILPTLLANKLYFLVLPFFLVAQFFSIVLLVWRLKPDVIHAHWLIPQGFWAALISQTCKIPAIVTGHGGDIFGLQKKIFRLAKVFTLKHVSALTVVSQPLADELYRQVGQSITPTVIPMGVDSTLFHPKKRSLSLRQRYRMKGPFILFVGRLTEKKGVGYLIDAMSSVVRSHPAAKLLIIGSGELEYVLKEKVKINGLTKEVIFAGSIANDYLPVYFATADIFVGPSINARGGDSEGFGLTFVEAGMSECLIIGTDVGGVSSIVRNGETGWLVEEKSSEALAQAITHCLNLDKTAANKMIAAARQYCLENYDWPIIARQYSDILSQFVRYLPSY